MCAKAWVQFKTNSASRGASEAILRPTFRWWVDANIFIPTCSGEQPKPNASRALLQAATVPSFYSLATLFSVSPIASGHHCCT